MKNSTHIYHLIELEFNSVIEPHQLKELGEWVQSSPDNLSDYQSFRKVLDYSERLAAMKEIDTAEDLKALKMKFAPKKKGRNLLITFQRIAAILIIPLLVYTAWSISKNLNQSMDKTAMTSTETTYGVRTQIELSDGSKVWLNSGSNLVYPEKFTGRTRTVKLTGEAYFEVESDSRHPFYVDLGGYQIKATGTKFDIYNYPDSPKMNTYLKDGVVALVGSKNGKEVKYTQLNEGELIVLDKKQNQFSIKKADERKFLGWMDGKLIFDKDPMEDVATRLGHWYNVDVLVDDEQLKDYVFTATFQKETLEEAMQLLSYSSPIKYEIIPSRQLDDSTYSKRHLIISKK